MLIGFGHLTMWMIRRWLKNLCSAPPSVCMRALMIFFALAQSAMAFEADTPVTPGASPEARALLAFITDIYGKKIIAGQQDGWRQTNGLSQELNYITNTAGKLP